MKNSKGLKLFAVLGLFLAVTTGYSAELVRVKVTAQTTNPTQPWRDNPMRERAGMAIVVDEHRLLTTETLVRNARNIEIQIPEQGLKYPAQILNVDPHLNMALLVWEHTNSHKSLALANTNVWQAGTEYQVRQLTSSDQVQQGQANLVRWYIASASDVPSHMLLAQLVCDLNIDGEGAAIINTHEQLAGIVASFDRASRVAQMIPASAINRYLADINNPPYQGTAMLGISWQPLNDPVKREFWGAGNLNGGVQVLGDSNALKANDILLAVADESVDSRGFYHHPHAGRLLFAHIINAHTRPGDLIPLRILRDKEILNIDVPCISPAARDPLIPENLVANPEPYLIDAGFVFFELTGRFLKAHGKPWQTRVDPRLAYLYMNQPAQAETQDRRIVILSQVLPDPVNIGYQDFNRMIVEAVNGIPINNLADLFDAVDSSGAIKQVKLRDVELPLQLDPTHRDDVNHRIAQQYRIPQLYRRPTIAIQ